MKLSLFVFAVYIFLASLASCKKVQPESLSFSYPKRVPALTDLSKNPIINSWILDTMKAFYYFSASLPSVTEKTSNPSDYFFNLLAGPAGIREPYSLFYPDSVSYNEANGNSARSYGFDYAVRPGNFGQNVVLMVTAVYPGGPAARAGVKRGDLILSVNLQAMGNAFLTFTVYNYKSLLSQSLTSFQFSTGAVKGANGNYTFPAPATSIKTLIKEPVLASPVVFTSIIPVSSRKVAYLVYRNFSSGPSYGSASYQTELAQAFASFKSGGATDLILDLRDASGYDMQSLVQLGSLVGRVQTGSQFGQSVTAGSMSGAGAPPAVNSVFFLTNLPEALGPQLSSIVILTNRATSGAAELFVHSLKANRPVTVVGDSTFGNGYVRKAFKDPTGTSSAFIVPAVGKYQDPLGKEIDVRGLVPDRLVKEEPYLIYPYGSNQDPVLTSALNSF